jgi:hypothetical protein
LLASPAATATPALLQLVVETRPVEFRHPHVAHDEIVAVLVKQHQRVAPVRGRVDCIVLQPERRRHEVSYGGIVVHHEDMRS